MRLLADRRALVTGGANGIGRAIVERFLDEGAAKVAVVDREVPPQLGERVVPLMFDLMETDKLPALLEAAEEALGTLDVLVNCAGTVHASAAVDMSYELYRRVLAVNLDAPIALATALARGMAERGYGRIVNITSIHGRFGARHHLAYDVSKAGLNQATRTLAIELARDGVLVNAVAPGFVATQMGILDEDVEGSERFQRLYVDSGRLPLGRQADPKEIASHVAWLASGENTYLTGQVVTVDGGLSATF